MANKKQGKIFGDSERDCHTLRPPSEKNLNVDSKTKILILVKKIFAAHKLLMGVSLVLVFLWTTAGQIILPVQYRFATFMGERMGDMNAEATRTALPASIEQTNAQANEQSNVQIHSSCISQLNSNAIAVYNGCLQKPDAILAICEFKKQQILDQSCEVYTPIPILKPITKGD